MAVKIKGTVDLSTAEEVDVQGEDDYAPSKIIPKPVDSFLDTITLGGTAKLRGAARKAKRGEYLGAGNDLVEGLGQSVAVPVIGGAVAAGGAAAIPSIAGGMAAGAALDYGVRTLGDKLGLDKEVSRAAGNLSGLIPVAGAGKKVLSGIKSRYSPTPKPVETPPIHPTSPDVTVTSKSTPVVNSGLKIKEEVDIPEFELTAPDNSKMRGFHQRRLYRDYPEEGTTNLAGTNFPIKDKFAPGPPKAEVGPTPIQQPLFEKDAPTQLIHGAPIAKGVEIDYFNRLNEYSRSPEFQSIPKHLQRQVVKSSSRLKKDLSPDELRLAKERATKAALEASPETTIPDLIPDSPASAWAIKKFYNDLTGKIGDKFSIGKRILIDKFSPIEDRYSSAEGSKTHLPSQDIRNRYDDALRYQKIALQTMDEVGFNKLVQELPEKEDLAKAGEYLIARHLTGLADSGENVGYGWRGFKRDYFIDKQLVAEGEGKYGEWGKRATGVANKVMDFAMREGLVDPKYVKDMREKYPDYITLHQIFDEDGAIKDVGKLTAIGSLPKQKTFRDRVLGGEGEFENPLVTLANRIEGVTREVLRNRTGKLLGEYAGAGRPELMLPEFQSVIKEVTPEKGSSGGVDGPLQFSFLDNGKRRVFETIPEIAIAAKGLETERLGHFKDIVQGFYRMAQITFTGTNPVFVMSNIFAKDPLTAFNFTTNKNPTGFVKEFPKSVYEVATRKGDYKDLEKRGAVGSFFDQFKIDEKFTDHSIERIQASRDPKELTRMTIKSPRELFRALEGIMGTGEEVTRTALWHSTFKEAMKKGMVEGEAKILADKAARKTTTDFYRKGDIGPVLNTLFPYVNAAIQGTRTLHRSFKDNPGATAVRVGMSMLSPVALTTAWNLADPERKEIYSKLDKNLREKHLILLLPGASIEQDKKSPEYGRLTPGSALLLPLPPGLNNIVSPVRRGMENRVMTDENQGMDYFKDVIKTLTPYGADTNEFISSFTPQYIRPAAEVMANRNFYTERPIVRNTTDPKSKQFDKGTSDFSKTAAKLTNDLTGFHPAPANIEHLIKGYAGPNITPLFNLAKGDVGEFSRKTIINPIRNRYLTPFAAGDIERGRRIREEKLNK